MGLKWIRGVVSGVKGPTLNISNVFSFVRFSDPMFAPKEMWSTWKCRECVRVKLGEAENHSWACIKVRPINEEHCLPTIKEYVQLNQLLKTQEACITYELLNWDFFHQNDNIDQGWENLLREWCTSSSWILDWLKMEC